MNRPYNYTSAWDEQFGTDGAMQYKVFNSGVK
jgi:hypothetical protein